MNLKTVHIIHIYYIFVLFCCQGKMGRFPLLLSRMQQRCYRKIYFILKIDNDLPTPEDPNRFYLNRGSRCLINEFLCFLSFRGSCMRDKQMEGRSRSVKINPFVDLSFYQNLGKGYSSIVSLEFQTTCT